MSQNTTMMDYLAPDISELATQRGRAGEGLSTKAKSEHNQTTRTLAWQLLPPCVVVPALFWWAVIMGVHREWFQWETGSIYFVYSVTAVFGLIVCLSLMKLSRIDAQKAQVQEQLKLAKDAAEEANRFKSMFFANISHEIRTPLTAINGFAELLLNPDRTDEQRLADARVIHRNGEHLLTLINDILDLSKIEAGKITVERLLCDPAGIIGDVCSMLHQRAIEKGLTLDVNFEGSIPKMIRTDPTRLRQVLINLVANSVKFTKEGGVRLNVKIQPTVIDDKPLLEIKITDTGIGIDPERLELLFQPFVQADSSISRQYGGSGLGLAISRHFARALGGDITVTSEPGKGSTFTVSVETGSLIGSAMHDHPEEATETLDNFTAMRVRISGSVLVAEDGLDNQALISAKLLETGLKVELAANGQIAYEKAVAFAELGNPFDLILMDVQMPVLDGFAATQKLRGKGYRGPIIALTANAMERDRSKCLSAGCNDFVTKPIKMEKLFKAIGKYMKILPADQEPTLEQKAPTSAQRDEQVRKFNLELPAELAQIEQAVERQDRQRLKEVARLVLGKAVAAGLKDLAPVAARFVESAVREPSWIALRQAAGEFSRELLPESKRFAA